MPGDAPRRLLRPLWLALVGITAVAALVVVEIAGDGLRQRVEQVRQERFLHNVQTLKTAVEGALALGLPLEQLPRVQDMLEAEHAATPGSLSIEIFDTHGRVLFGTDRSFLGDLVNERWLDLAAAAKGQPSWHGQDGAARVVGAPVVNGFGGVLGHVALRYDSVSRDSMPSFPAQAVAAMGGAVLAFAILLAWAFGRLYAGLGANLSQARLALAGQSTSWTPPLAAQAAEARQRVDRRLAAMDAALAEARRMDDDA